MIILRTVLVALTLLIGSVILITPRMTHAEGALNGNTAAHVKFTIRVHEVLSVTLHDGILHTSNNSGNTMIVHNGGDFIDVKPLSGLASTRQTIEAAAPHKRDEYTIASP